MSISNVWLLVVGLGNVIPGGALFMPIETGRETLDLKPCNTDPANDLRLQGLLVWCEDSNGVADLVSVDDPCIRHGASSDDGRSSFLVAVSVGAVAIVSRLQFNGPAEVDALLYSGIHDSNRDVGQFFLGARETAVLVARIRELVVSVRFPKL